MPCPGPHQGSTGPETFPSNPLTPKFHPCHSEEPQATRNPLFSWSFSTPQSPSPHPSEPQENFSSRLLTPTPRAVILSPGVFTGTKDLNSKCQHKRRPSPSIAFRISHFAFQLLTVNFQPRPQRKSATPPINPRYNIASHEMPHLQNRPNPPRQNRRYPRTR